MAILTAVEVTSLEGSVAAVKAQLNKARQRLSSGLWSQAYNLALEARGLFYTFAGRLSASQANSIDGQISGIITKVNAEKAAASLTWLDGAASRVMDALDSAYSATIKPTLDLATSKIREAIAQYDYQMASLAQSENSARLALQAADKMATSAARDSIRADASALLSNVASTRSSIQNKQVTVAGIGTGSTSMWIETMRGLMQKMGLGEIGALTFTLATVITVSAAATIILTALSISKAVVAKEATQQKDLETSVVRAGQSETKSVNDLKISTADALAKAIANGAPQATIDALKAKLDVLSGIKTYEVPPDYFKKPDAESPWYASFVQNVGWVVLIGIGAVVTVKYILPEVKRRLDARKSFPAGA